MGRQGRAGDGKGRWKKGGKKREGMLGRLRGDGRSEGRKGRAEKSKGRWKRE